MSDEIYPINSNDFIESLKVDLNADNTPRFVGNPDVTALLVLFDSIFQDTSKILFNS